MEKYMEKNQSISRNLVQLRKRVRRLNRVPMRKLGDAVCDIIDLKGFGLAVLLRCLPKIKDERQVVIAQKIEDFLYFHPHKGVRLFDRLKKAFFAASELCRPHLLAAMVDVSEKLPNGAEELLGLIAEARVVLESAPDFIRKGKAVEIIAMANKKEYIIDIINNMVISTKKIAEFANYHFFENCLLAVKRMGGESLLRLLINPNSDNAIKQLRLEWRSEKPDLVAKVLRASECLNTEFAQAALHVIDLSDFNLPFVSMIQEGMSHPDKWVRQAAVISMQKASEALSPEILARMLNDPSPEVRLMAVSSLGGYPIEKTGAILESLAAKEGETVGQRMNALYALHSQKNLPALEKLSSSVDPKVALNSMGLAALLKPDSETLGNLLKFFLSVGPSRAVELQYYVLELIEPDGLKMLVDLHRDSKGGQQKENCLILLKAFLMKNAGPKLERAKRLLSDAERKALGLLAAEAGVSV